MGSGDGEALSQRICASKHHQVALNTSPRGDRRGPRLAAQAPAGRGPRGVPPACWAGPSAVAGPRARRAARCRPTSAAEGGLLCTERLPELTPKVLTCVGQG